MSKQIYPTMERYTFTPPRWPFLAYCQTTNDNKALLCLFYDVRFYVNRVDAARSSERRKASPLKRPCQLISFLVCSSAFLLEKLTVTASFGGAVTLPMMLRLFAILRLTHLSVLKSNATTTLMPRWSEPRKGFPNEGCDMVAS